MLGENLYAKGYAHYEKKEWDYAADCFRELCLIAPKDPRSWDALGKTLQEAESFQEAQRAFDMAAFLKPTDPYPMLHTAECLLSMALRALDQAKQNVDDADPLKGRIEVLKQQWSA